MIGYTPHELDLRAAAAEADPVLAGVIAQLDAVKAFIAEHKPPVTQHYPMTLGYCASSAAEVDRICAVIGIKPSWVNEHTYAAEKPFGTEARYRVAYIAKVFEQPAPVSREDAPEMAGSVAA